MSFVGVLCNGVWVLYSTALFSHKVAIWKREGEAGAMRESTITCVPCLAGRLLN